MFSFVFATLLATATCAPVWNGIVANFTSTTKQTTLYADKNIILMQARAADYPPGVALIQHSIDTRVFYDNETIYHELASTAGYRRYFTCVKKDETSGNCAPFGNYLALVVYEGPEPTHGVPHASDDIPVSLVVIDLGFSFRPLKVLRNNARSVIQGVTPYWGVHLTQYHSSSNALTIPFIDPRTGFATIYKFSTSLIRSSVLYASISRDFFGLKKHPISVNLKSGSSKYAIFDQMFFPDNRHNSLLGNTTIALVSASKGKSSIVEAKGRFYDYLGAYTASRKQYALFENSTYLGNIMQVTRLSVSDSNPQMEPMCQLQLPYGLSLSDQKQRIILETPNRVVFCHGRRSLGYAITVCDLAKNTTQIVSKVAAGGWMLLMSDGSYLESSVTTTYTSVSLRKVASSLGKTIHVAHGSLVAPVLSFYGDCNTAACDPWQFKTFVASLRDPISGQTSIFQLNFSSKLATAVDSGDILVVSPTFKQASALRLRSKYMYYFKTAGTNYEIRAINMDRSASSNPSHAMTVAKITGDPELVYSVDTPGTLSTSTAVIHFNNVLYRIVDGEFGAAIKLSAPFSEDILAFAYDRTTGDLYVNTGLDVVQQSDDQPPVSTSRYNVTSAGSGFPLAPAHANMISVGGDFFATVAQQSRTFFNNGPAHLIRL